MLIKILILLGLVKLLKISNSAALCAVIYGVAVLIFTFVSKGNFSQALIISIIGCGLSFIWFWFLHKTEGNWFWWVILIGGVSIGLV